MFGAGKFIAKYLIDFKVEREREMKIKMNITLCDMVLLILFRLS